MLYPSYAAMALRQAAVTQPHKGRVIVGRAIVGAQSCRCCARQSSAARGRGGCTERLCDRVGLASE
jgi:hypothetical protein